MTISPSYSCFFFFSSRRRHTRWNCDWSSDVCSSDLEGTLFVPQPNKLKGRKRWIAFFHHPKGALFVDAGAKNALREKGTSRSEERRVGKECRSPWTPLP